MGAGRDLCSNLWVEFVIRGFCSGVLDPGRGRGIVWLGCKPPSALRGAGVRDRLILLLGRGI